MKQLTCQEPTGAAPDSPRQTAAPSMPRAAQGEGLQWLDLSAERADEVAVEVRQLAAAAASVRGRLTFDSEPADWDTAFARWQGEPR